MNKRSLTCLLVMLLAAVLFSGCQSANPTVEAAGNTVSTSNCYQVEFLGVTESSEVTTTWRYRLPEQACAKQLSNWMLELPACASVVNASPGPWEIVSPDTQYKLSGIKWQTGPEAQSGEFSVTLTGDLEKGVTRTGLARSKGQYQDVSIGSMAGPVCKGQATAVASLPKAKVTVQSANCRAQPVGKAKKIVLLYRNQEVEIAGRNDDPNNPWWYVKLPNQDGNCWLWGKTATTSGNVDGLPIVK